MSVIGVNERGSKRAADKQPHEEEMVMALRKYIAVVAALVFFVLPGVSFADDTYGVGGGDYLINNGSPDLLDDAAKNGDGTDIYDPLEPVNRVFFAFNDKLYFWVLKPVKQGYTAVVPYDFRFVIGNFFDNLSSPVDFVNTLLQGRFADAGIVLSRFVINTTLGVFGFGDVAAEAFDLQPKSGDFGQTLGVYGIGEGIFLNWPFFGPSNIRDSVGLVADMQLHPINYLGLDSNEVLAARGEEVVNSMSIKPETYEELKRIAVDPYVASRQAYADYRRNLIAVQKKAK